MVTSLASVSGLARHVLADAGRLIADAGHCLLDARIAPPHAKLDLCAGGAGRE